jgi:flavin-dependent dehydrogenase
VVNEVTIAGGGPAGAALAVELGRRGVPVVLYEKARHPRLKPCGEGLLPHGVSALQRIAGLPDVPRVRGLRFAAGGSTVDADFPDGPGLVVRRDRFDAWLFEQAAATPNVDVRPGTPYRKTPGRFVVGADGLHSAFHRRRPAATHSANRVGLSRHVLGIDGLGDRVEVFFHDEGEVFVAPTGGGEALVSVLSDRRHFRRDGVTHFLHVIPALRARIARLEHTSPVLASAPLGIRVPRVVDQATGLLLAGDAAGAPDSITAGGLALALLATQPAADAIVSGALEPYQRQRLALGRSADRLAALMLGLSRTERRATLTLRYLSALIPPVLTAVVRQTVPESSHVDA